MNTNVHKAWSYAILVAFITIAVLCAVTLIATLPGWGEKKPEWVAALGTIAAFSGTIWIATSERRRRRSESIDIAILAGAQIFDRVNVANERMISIQAALGTGILDEASRLSASRKLDSLEIWTSEELLPLTCLPNHIAARLQRVIARRTRMLKWLETLSKPLSSERRDRLIGLLRTDTQKCLKDTQASKAELMKILGPIFSTDE